jgi:hypothetical protein
VEVDDQDATYLGPFLFEVENVTTPGFSWQIVWRGGKLSQELLASVTKQPESSVEDGWIPVQVCACPRLLTPCLHTCSCLSRAPFSRAFLARLSRAFSHRPRLDPGLTQISMTAQQTSAGRLGGSSQIVAMQVGRPSLAFERTSA